MKDEIGYLQKFWNHIKGIPENTEYGIEIDENTTITKTIVDHIKDIYSDIKAFVGGTSTESELVKVSVESGSGVPSVDVPVGLRYAKNTSSAADVTEDMYKYVGVIDSPDDFQRVYSAQQVDDIINPLIARIEALEGALGINNNETT